MEVMETEFKYGRDLRVMMDEFYRYLTEDIGSILIVLGTPVPFYLDSPACRNTVAHKRSSWFLASCITALIFQFTCF